MKLAGKTLPNQFLMQSSTSASSQISVPSTDLPKWLTFEAPLLNTIGFSAIVAALIGIMGKYIVDSKLEQQRQRNTERINLIKTWEELLNDKSLGINDFIEHSTYPSLEVFLSQKGKKEIEPLIKYALLEREGVIPPGKLIGQVSFCSNDTRFRDILKQEILHIKIVWKLM
ncbi:hypothetical protein [Leptolyngbya sp. BL0902]|uniref:hypothetical protein n=1 Tax=Leptolyngbya sp. BL0902 TaxID=1115757 RepID=UPI0018E8A0A6|nr:hypothetical protein [Leptolyngbya sp. BL0902]